MKPTERTTKPTFYETVVGDWITSETAVQLFGLRRPTLAAATREGRVPYRKVGAGSRAPKIMRVADILVWLRKSKKVHADRTVNID